MRLATDPHIQPDRLEPQRCAASFGRQPALLSPALPLVTPQSSWYLLAAAGPDAAPPFPRAPPQDPHTQASLRRGSRAIEYSKYGQRLLLTSRAAVQHRCSASRSTACHAAQPATLRRICCSAGRRDFRCLSPSGDACLNFPFTLRESLGCAFPAQCTKFTRLPIESSTPPLSAVLCEFCCLPSAVALCTAVAPQQTFAHSPVQDSSDRLTLASRPGAVLTFFPANSAPPEKPHERPLDTPISSSPPLHPTPHRT